MFFGTRNFLKHRRVPLRNDSVLRDNKYSIEVRDTPLLGTHFFVTRNFLKHRSFPLRIVLVLPDIFIENFDMTLLREEIFRNSKLVTHYWVPCERFRFCETIFFYRRSLYSPLKPNVFRYPKLSETQKGSSSK